MPGTISISRPASRNSLAFWTYDVFNFNNRTPYLLLPSTQSDTYANMGRGYIGGRFRGKDMLYLESEYRYGITSNGFLGGVVFINAQSFTEPVTNRFEAIAPGWGAGIRIKLNKFPDQYLPGLWIRPPRLSRHLRQSGRSILTELRSPIFLYALVTSRWSLKSASAYNSCITRCRLLKYYLLRHPLYAQPRCRVERR